MLVAYGLPENGISEGGLEELTLTSLFDQASYAKTVHAGSIYQAANINPTHDHFSGF